MATAVTHYTIQWFGNSGEGETELARIALFGESGVAAFLIFPRPDKELGKDAETGANVEMYLPPEMFQSVLDTLRHERPVYIDFLRGRGRLSTKPDPAAG